MAKKSSDGRGLVKFLGHRRFNVETLFWLFWGPLLAVVIILVVVGLVFY